MKVAIAQISPVLLDRDQTIKKVCRSIANAASQGARLIAFGESLVPAYPLWLCRTDGARFDAADQKELHAQYVDQAVCIEAGHLASVCSSAREHSIAVVIGIAERAADKGGHSLYCSRVMIDRQGSILSVHRKLMPTHEERLCWGIGDGAGLRTHLIDEFTVGALNCWENWMPLARTALYAAGENLHVMLWPGCLRLTQDITRFVAREGRCFVMSASALIRPQDIPESVPSRERMCGSESVFYDGGSCIAAPNGDWVVKPQVGEEQLITADLDLQAVYAERQNFDPVGHYFRPDVFDLSVNRRRQQAAQFND